VELSLSQSPSLSLAAYFPDLACRSQDVTVCKTGYSRKSISIVTVMTASIFDQNPHGYSFVPKGLKLCNLGIQVFGIIFKI
jgi:hypothetical protein